MFFIVWYIFSIANVYVVFICIFFFLINTGLVLRLSQFSAKFSGLGLGCITATTEAPSIQNKQHSSLSAGAVFWRRNTVIEAKGGTIKSVVENFPTPPQTSPFDAAAAYSYAKIMMRTRAFNFVWERPTNESRSVGVEPFWGRVTEGQKVTVNAFILYSHFSCL